MRSDSGSGAGPLASAEDYGYSYIHKFGSNPDVDTGTVPEDIWDGPTALYPFPAAAGAVTVVSSDAADAAPLGTGMRTVRVFGLDANGLEITEDIALNGVGAVPLANQYLRLHRAHGLTAGTGGVNAGVITFTHAVAGVITVIGVGSGQTLMAVFTTPFNAARVSLLSFRASLGRTVAASGVTLQLLSRSLLVATPCWRTREIFELITVGSSLWIARYPVPLPIGAGEDWRLVCTVASATNLEVSGGFDITYRVP